MGTDAAACGESAMTTGWFKNAIIYGLDVKRFQDSNGDGIGDFNGLRNRLDYLADLGVTCLWLLPFYPSPNRDNGYDITDYCAIHPALGTLDDFRAMLAEAHARNLRVMTDFVANHTSDQHPWFQAARRDSESPYRDYYIWSKERPDTSIFSTIFPGVEEGVWSYDDVAEAYYFHVFYHFQPDLNPHNPAVREEYRKIIKFWLDLGVDGFRLDAAPHLITNKGASEGAVVHSHEILRELRAFMERHDPEAILFAEADASPEQLEAYVGSGNEMHLLLNFYLNGYLWLALARENAEPLRRALHGYEVSCEASWVNLARNLDELYLGGLSDEDRDFTLDTFAPDPDARIYNRGVRRRLPSLLGNNRARMELAYSLIFSLPGTPLIIYGEEIGMGDDLAQPERESVRAVMQWNDKTNGGFSTAPSSQIVYPLLRGGDYGYARVNVAAQQRDPTSLLCWMKRVIEARKSAPEIGQGKWLLLDTEHSAALAHVFMHNDAHLVVLHNLSPQPHEVRVEFDAGARCVTELFSDRAYAPVQQGSLKVHLGGFGYRWLRVTV